MEVVRAHRHWYQRLAVRLDPLLENEPPGRTRLEAIVDAWLDLALATPGWPRRLQRFADCPPVRKEVAHQLERLAQLITVDLLLAGGEPGTESARRLVGALADVALQEAEVGHGLPPLRRSLIASSLPRSARNARAAPPPVHGLP